MTGGSVGSPAPPARVGWTGGLTAWISTTDHKRIGLLYIGTAFAFFLFAGLLALLMRLELAQPGLQFIALETYNESFTMHGSIMMLVFATPMVSGFANFLVPLQIGTAEMAFPRVNALSYWLFLFGSLIVLASYMGVGGAADVGWTAYPPLSRRTFAPAAGVDLWLVGLLLGGVASILGAVNFLSTILTRRAPGLTMLRLPIFTWGIIATSALILFAFPAVTAAFAMLLIDRQAGGHFFDPLAGGDPILYQHIFWFFGHPEVYIVILPFFGVLSEVIPVFSRKPIFGYRGMVLAFLIIVGYSMSVWAHHMFTTDAVSLPFFSLASFIIAVPTGIKIFNWIATMWRGHLRFTTAMLFAAGTFSLFVLGGISGVIVASPPLDFHLHDTYYVVAHMHNVLVTGTVTGMFAGFYFWFPKASGRVLSEPLGKLHFWSWMLGFVLTFLPQYQLGASGMPRRFADYPAEPGWAELNLASTAGSMLLGLSALAFLLNVVRTLRRPADAPDDPWGGNSLEWATTSPPPHGNFRWLPPIRSERPVHDWRVARTGAPPETLTPPTDQPGSG
jgi:cytochrome c oxidase subunit 1